MTKVLIVDTSLLGNIFADGPKTGIKILNDLKSNYDSLIVPDRVAREVSFAPFKQDFDKWMSAN